MKAVIFILVILTIYLFIFALCRVAGVADQTTKEIMEKKHKEKNNE